ncbi:hypothetical protein AG1IA_03104 [Rhizoctonia solani AG-1 IA]|uniref:DUF6593 domain-containing protein n=1 Tax=Thanatephorus cucumeris (strain AG1-IA) TaxID=983506 RepID=L8X1B9_THACA|nr:hypothetical protein AG1IA_03104 [Rhizoctonia solani AG-1 IA]
MTTYVLSRTSPKNTTLIDPEGSTFYEVRKRCKRIDLPANISKVTSKYHLGGSDTTIKRGDQVLATIHWKVFKRSTITWDGETMFIKEIFPRTGRFSTYEKPFNYYNTNPDRYPDSGLNLAVYDRTHLHHFRSKKSTLEITASGSHLADALIITWAIAENKARHRRRSRRNGGGGGGDGGG